MTQTLGTVKGRALRGAWRHASLKGDALDILYRCGGC